MSDDQLRRAYQARRSVRSGSPPPTAEELAALVAGTGTEEERLAVLDQALSDPESARRLELLRAISEAERSEVPGRTSPRWVPMALAATITLAISATLLVLSLRKADTLRAPPAQGAAVPIAPDDAATRAPGSLTFVWHPAPGAAGYRLELLAESGGLVASTNTRDTTATLVAGNAGAYRWIVVALLPDGVEVLSLPRRIRITP